MSSIIDALKKSDNSRTNESDTNINQIKFGNQPPPKSRRGFWLLVALLILVTIGVFAWTQGWHHSVISQIQNWFVSDQVDSDQATQLVADSKPTDNKQMAAETATKPATKPATERSNTLTPPTPDEVKAKSLATDQAKSEIDKDRQKKAELTAAQESDVPNNDDTKITATTGDESVETKASSTIQPEEVDDAVNKTELIAQQHSKDLEPTLKQDYLLIHQIDFEIRKNIPPIKLNIHIYDPVPENRMVILNGVKYETGDSIEDLVTVEEINQQGVVLVFEGIKFLIPK